MSATTPTRLVPAGPCRAKNPAECRYHGAFFRLGVAADEGDYAVWLKEREVIASSEKDEFAWLEKAAGELNLRDPEKRFFTEDDVRIHLIRRLMRSQTEASIRAALSSDVPASPEAVEGAQKAVFRAMECLAETRPTVKRRNLLSRPMSAEKFRETFDRLRGGVIRYVTDSLPRQQENVVMGSFRPSRNSPWTKGVVEFAPYPYDKEGMWINMVYQSNPDEEGKRGSIASGGYYEDVEQWLRITEVSDNVKDFALNKYDPSSTEPVFRRSYYDAIDRLGDRTWVGGLDRRTGLPTWV